MKYVLLCALVLGTSAAFAATGKNGGGRGKSQPKFEESELVKGTVERHRSKSNGGGVKEKTK